MAFRKAQQERRNRGRVGCELDAHALAKVGGPVDTGLLDEPMLLVEGDRRPIVRVHHQHVGAPWVEAGVQFSKQRTSDAASLLGGVNVDAVQLRLGPPRSRSAGSQRPGYPARRGETAPRRLERSA